MATGVKHEIRVFRFGHVGWAIWKALDLATCRLPDKRGDLVHEELSERPARACKAQKVKRMNVCSELSRLSARGPNNVTKYTY